MEKAYSENQDKPARVDIMRKSHYPVLYQINTRVWLTEL
jgi:hypothetical protein